MVTQSFTPQILTIGTGVVQILAPKENRTQYNIVFPSVGKISTNTGLIYIGINTVPNPIAGGNASGHIMANSEEFGENDDFYNRNIKGSANVSKGAIYAVASTAGQIIEVYEVVQ